MSMRNLPLIEQHGRGDWTLQTATEEWSNGDIVVVRANQHKWLQGRVKRLSRGGIRVWVGEAQMLVHVPQELVSTHLIKLSNPSISTTLPSVATSRNSLVRIPTQYPGRLLVLCVRPAHLSHRNLFHYIDSTEACPACGLSFLEHHKNNDIPPRCARCGYLNHQSKLQQFAEQQQRQQQQQQQQQEDQENSEPSWSATSIIYGAQYRKLPERSRTPSPHAKLESIPEGNSLPGSMGDELNIRNTTQNYTQALPSDYGGVSSSSKEQQHIELHATLENRPHPRIEISSPSVSPPSSGPSSSPSPSNMSGISVAERMKKLNLNHSSSGSSSSTEVSPYQEPHYEVSPSWISVIKEGHNMRSTFQRENIEKIANAKEKAMSEGPRRR